MSDTKISIFNADGQSAYIDYRTEATNLEGRQVVVLGDPSINNNVVSVQQTDPLSNTQGLVVRDVNTSAVAAFLAGTQRIYLESTAGTLAVQLKAGTLAVSLDPGHELGSIKGITNTIGAYIDSTQGTLAVQLKAGTLAVQLDPGHLLGSVTANAGTGTFNVQFDPGHELGSIKGITNSINVYLGATAGTLNMALKPGTIAVSLDPGYTLGKIDQGNAQTSGTQAWLINQQGTASVFTATGTASGVSTSGNTIISPSANASFKVYAFSIQTTGQVSLVTKFTNGSGGSPTEFWRPLITASGVTGAQGANLSTGGPGNPLFVTGTSTTLSLVLDSSTLVHYSVSYTKESA